MAATARGEPSVLQSERQGAKVLLKSPYFPQPTASTLSIGATAVERYASRQGKDMNMELKYPQWQMPFENALLDPTKLLEIETVIRKRLHLLTGSGRLDEQQALTDALSTIRVLKRDRKP